MAFFEKHIRPLLIERCYACHSEEEKIKGGLRLDLREGWETGGDSGRAITEGSPAESLLFEAIQFNNPDLEMPPKGKLPDAEIALIQTWIEMGAPDPRDGTFHGPEEHSIDLEAGRQFWSFQPLRSTPTPEVSDPTWPRNPVDHFVMVQWDEAAIQPVEDAAPDALLRRLYFDLTGLPPDTATLKAFASEPTESHYAAIVDKLLASEAYGEKWGRHWLDLARYAESTGGGRSSVLANAWRYRNYVIQSYNQDKPIDRFIQEQLAGDLLPWTSPEQRHDQLVATAFLAIGPKNLDLQDKEMLRMNTVDEQIDTVGQALLGMTLGCVRCHAHKFDPIPMEDYYALAGIFRSTRTLIRENVSLLVEQALPVSEQRRQAYQAYRSAATQLEKAIKTAKKTKDPSEADKARLKDLEHQLAALKQTAPAPLPKAIGVSDEKETGDYALCVRGNVHQLGDPVRRGFLQVTQRPDHKPPTIPSGESGRRQLAEWLTSKDHPLTARVYVNRIWQHVFGLGIVRSVDNFGATGDAPTHPELLDYLSGYFMDHQWSTKQLVRHLVLSHTYRLGTADNPVNREKDPDRTLRWAMERRRLPAEAIRDAILVASGSLKTGRIDSMLPGAASSDSALRNAKLDYERIVNPSVRSVYIPIFREEGRNPLLDAFDFANPSFTVGRRVPGVRPTQSLYLMNNDWIMEQAETAARRLIATHPSSPEKRLHQAYLWTLSRVPSAEEKEVALDYLQLHAHRDDPQAAWSGMFHALFSCVDFRYIH